MRPDGQIYPRFGRRLVLVLVAGASDGLMQLSCTKALHGG
jgi:hypothetical protein